MKKMFGIMLMLLVLGLLCGVASANEKRSSLQVVAPSMVVAEMTGDTVIDVVLVALGTEQSGVVALVELSDDEKGCGPLIFAAGAFLDRSFATAIPATAISYLPDINGSAV